MLDRALIERCPLCMELNRSPWLYGLGFELVRCDACGHRYSTSVHAHIGAGAEAETAESVEELELAAESTRGDAAQRKRFNEYLQLLGPALPAQARVLDVGCDSGELLALFVAHGFQAFGIERNPAAMREAHARLGVPIWLGRVQDDLPANERFDLIVLSHVLEHTYGPGALLDRLRVALREGGRLLIEVPNADDRLLSLWRGAYRLLYPGEHVSFFDASHLRQLLHSRGFVIERLAAPTHARDLLIPSMQSALDAARTTFGRSRTRGWRGLYSSMERAPLRWPLRAAVDAGLELLDPIVARATGLHNSKERAPRGPVLIAGARPASA
jgi:SAM-dependent methyltransferase